ncbi:uncharacterized protein LOC142330567 [Lycorma delicatula]|uniref:uncharacterized protein LOC142330567 n=1 Tax=Lycorma delicatula TaxID=130591 RepID=UPI003F514420
MKFLIFYICFNYLMARFIFTISVPINEKLQEKVNSEELFGEYESLYENDDVEKKLNNSLCSQNETEKLQELITTCDLISKGEEETGKQNHNEDNTILVLGNRKSGKTLFVKFMAGDISKLISKGNTFNSRKYLIEDTNKVISSASEEINLYPKQVSDYSGITFTDTPGFSKTRSKKHELVAAFAMKKYLMNIKNVKIVLLIDFHSVVHGSNRSDFLSLLQNVNKFLTTNENYKNSISLVVTKVPYLYEVGKNNFASVSYETIINSVVSYMTDVKITLKYELKQINDDNERQLLKNAIKMIEFLLETDKEGNIKKINIFPQPTEPGKLSESLLFKQGKLSLRQTILKNLNYTRTSVNELGYKLSERTKNYLNCLLLYINDIVADRSSYIFKKVNDHYESKISNYRSIYEVNSQIKEIVQKLITLKNNLNESENYSHFSIIYEFIKKETIINTKMENKTDFEVLKYISTFQQFINVSETLSSITWAKKIQKYINYVVRIQRWYDTLIKMFNVFSSYSIQTMKSNFSDTKDNFKSLKTIISNHDKKLYEYFHSQVNLTDLNVYRKMAIDNIVHVTMSKDNITCVSDGTLTLSGFYVKLSSINDNDLLRNYCSNLNLKFIRIFAINTVFIDADLANNHFKGINIMIVAPKWEIIGERKINVDGIAGKNHYSSTADGEYLGDDGKDGMPGLPGGNGGNFFGIGLYFKNEENLFISTNGGSGGNGQHGGFGKNGTNGKEGYENFFINPPTNDNYDVFLKKGSKEFKFRDAKSAKMNFPEDYFRSGNSAAHIKIYKRAGNCGNIGGRGGNGGVGGMGGNPGKVILIGKFSTGKFSFTSLHGKLGCPGMGGDGGFRGKHGTTYLCLKVLVRQYYPDFEPENFWNCFSLSDQISEHCAKNLSKNLNGQSNFTVSDILLPDKVKTLDVSDNLHDYIALLKNYESNSLLLKIVKEFLDYISNQHVII